MHWRGRLRSSPGPRPPAPRPSPAAPPQLPLWCQGRYQGQEMLAVVLGGVSGQQEYLSKVLLQTSSARQSRAGWEGPLSRARPTRPGLPSCLLLEAPAYHPLLPSMQPSPTPLAHLPSPACPKPTRARPSSQRPLAMPPSLGAEPLSVGFLPGSSPESVAHIPFPSARHRLPPSIGQRLSASLPVCPNPLLYPR